MITSDMYILCFFGLLLTLNFLGLLFLIWLIGGFYKKISVSDKHSLEKMYKQLEEERISGYQPKSSGKQGVPPKKP